MTFLIICPENGPYSRECKSFVGPGTNQKDPTPIKRRVFTPVRTLTLVLVMQLLIVVLQILLGLIPYVVLGEVRDQSEQNSQYQCQERNKQDREDGGQDKQGAQTEFFPHTCLVLVEL